MDRKSRLTGKEIFVISKKGKVVAKVCWKIRQIPTSYSCSICKHAFNLPIHLFLVFPGERKCCERRRRFFASISVKAF